MSKALVLGSMLGGPLESSQPYHFATDYQPASAEPVVLSVRTEAELESLQQSVAFSNTLFGVGLSTTVVGVGVMSLGVATMVIGIIPVLVGESTMFDAGLVMIAVGGAVTTVALPVTLCGAMLGSAALRRHGEDVTSVPGWLGLSGLGLVVAGAAMDVPPLTSAGGVMFLGGSISQVIITNRAMKKIKQEGEASSALMLHPVPVLDGYGLGLTLRR